MVTHAEVPNRAAPPVAPALTLVTADAPATTSIATPVPVHPVNCNDSKVLDRTGHAPAEARPDTTDPLTGQLSRLHITVTRELLARVEAAQIALSHARPGATIADLLELGADTALAQDAKRKGLVQKPRACRAETPPPGPESNHIPAHIRRAVWERDHGCCQWKLDNGEICGSRYRLQFDHIKPRAQGGHTTVANIRLLCQRHNLLAARVAYGEELMNRYRRLSVRDAAEGGRASALRRSKVQLAGAVSG